MSTGKFQARPPTTPAPPLRAAQQVASQQVVSQQRSTSTSTTTQRTVNSRTVFPTVPRVGGGIDGDSFWTGGSIIPSSKYFRTTPKSISARRPTSFRDQSKINDICRVGLGDSFLLHVNPGASNTTSLTSWVKSTSWEAELRGFDYLFRIYDDSNHSERCLFDNFGNMDRAQVDKWVQDLTIHGVLNQGTRQPVCQFDATNLQMSGSMIKNSIHEDLWRLIEPDVGYSANGVHIFVAAVQHIQINSAATNRLLVDQLRAMTLSDEPGQNVNTFSQKVIDLASRIDSGSGHCSDLSSLVLKTFLSASCKTFYNRAVTHYNEADQNGSTDWRSVITDLKNAYLKDKGLGLWVASATTKAGQESQDEDRQFKTLVAQVSTLTQLVQKHTGTPTTASPTTTTDSTGGNRGRKRHEWRQDYTDGEPMTKIVNGIHYSYCPKCKWWTFGKGEHTGETHKSRTPPTLGGTPAATPAATTPIPGGAAKLASKTVTFDDNTPVPRQHLRMIGHLFMSSASAPPPSTTGSDDLPSPFLDSISDEAADTRGLNVPPPPTHDAVPSLGHCDVCDTYGPVGTFCLECDDPACLYEEPLTCGPCTICGDIGPTGLFCDECGSDGGIYESAPIITREPPSPRPTTTEDITRLLEQIPGDLIAAAARSTAPPSSEEALRSSDSDDASFTSALTHVSSTSTQHVRLPGPPHHLNFFAGQDSS